MTRFSYRPFLTLFIFFFTLFQANSLLAQFQEEEPNDDFPSANQLNVGAFPQITGVVGSGGDHLDHFLVHVPVSCDFKVRYSASPNISMQMKLLNASQGQLATMPSYNASGSDSLTFNCMAAGDYYIQIGDLPFNTTPNPYTIEMEMNDPLTVDYLDGEFNDTRDSAKWINLVSIGPNQYGFSAKGNMRYRNNPSTVDQEDWFKFVVPQHGELSALVIANEALQLSIIPEHANQAYTIFTGEIAGCIAPDTFYLRLTTGSFGDCFWYDTQVILTTATSVPTEQEPNDVLADAQAIGGNHTDRIGYYTWGDNGTATQDELDFFQLITTQAGNVIIEIDPDSTITNYYPDLYSSGTGSNVLLPLTRTGNSSQGESVQLSLFCAQPDTFYLKMHAMSGCGSYHISYYSEVIDVGTGATEIEPNNTVTEAQEISTSHMVVSNVDHRNYSHHPILVEDDFDFFTFTPETEGTLRIVGTTQTGIAPSIDLLLMDSAYNEIVEETVTDTILLPCSARVPYFLQVDGACAQYRLEWEVLSDYLTDQEPNDVISQALSFPIATSVTSREGRLGAYQQASGLNDVADYYKVMMSGPGNVMLWLTGEDGNGTLDVWSQDGILHSSYFAVNGDSVVADLGCLAQDTFYISVSGVNCNGYRVSAQVVTNAGIADQEPNNSIAQAMTISQTSTLNGTLGAQHIGTIQLSDVRDYYRLVMPDHGQLSASVVMSTPSTNSTLLVQLLYSDGVTVHQSDTLWNGSAQIELTCMQPDTLYLKVEQMLIGIECHVYNLFVEMTADPGTSDAEPNNSDQQAVELSSGQSAQGLLGYFRYGTASNDGIDVYRFDAQAGDVALSFNHFEVLQNAWITVSSASQPSMLIVLAEDIPSFGLYLDTLDVMQNEAIYVSIQDADECGAYELQLTQLNYLGIGDRSSENGDLIIYPNPAKAYLGIHIAGNLSDGTITIFDMLGRSKYEGQWGAEKPMEINIEHFESGIYSVVFQNGENQMIGKVVVAN